MKATHLLITALVLGAVATESMAGGGAYPLPAVPESTFVKSRAQVKAELREAARLGLLSFGEGDVPVPTREQESIIADAGQRAADKVLLAGEVKAEAKK